MADVRNYNEKYMEVALIDIIYRALQEKEDPYIKKISYDGDHKSCELIITMHVGYTQSSFVLSSKSLKEFESTVVG